MDGVDGGDLAVLVALIRADTGGAHRCYRDAVYGEMRRAAGEHLAAVAGKVADSDDSFDRKVPCASSLAQLVVAEPGRTLLGDGCDHSFDSVCMSDLQHSKQPLVPSPSPSGININRDISVDAVFIVRKVRPENAPAVKALVERPIRDW